MTSGAAHIFDRRLLRSRRERALAGGAPADFLWRFAAEEIAGRLAVVNRTFPLAADLGCLGGLVGARLRRTGKVGTVLAFEGSFTAARGAEGPVAVADEEALPLKEGAFDLVVSALSLQWANDLPGALVQIRRALRPDGLFLASLVGGDTLGELRMALIEAESEIAGGAAPRVAPFAEVRELGGLLQRAGFALPVTDTDRLTVRYCDALALMRDLRAMGATNPLAERAGRPLSRSILARAGEIYASRFADDDGRIRATFELIHLTGWAPHQSQPRPLRPGSARMRLADALGTQERSAGDKAGFARRRR